MADLSPSRAAIQLYKAWSFGKTDDELFPINCKAIAEGLGIKVVGGEINDDFQGCLVLTGDFNAIIYNSTITSAGRINYTIGHELGHYCLHKNRGDLHCSLDDLNNMGKAQPHTKDIEKEANQFAANLLMPTSDVRTLIKNQIPSIQLAEKLKVRYETSLLATLYRVVLLSQYPACFILLDRHECVKSVYRNKRFTEYFFQKGKELPFEIKHTANVLPVDFESLQSGQNYSELLFSAVVFHGVALTYVLLTY